MSGANASLRAMFPDANPALLDRALEHCGGDVERAVDYLLANPPPPSAESASAPPQVHAQTVGGEAIAAARARLDAESANVATGYPAAMGDPSGLPYPHAAPVPTPHDPRWQQRPSAPAAATPARAFAAAAARIADVIGDSASSADIDAALAANGGDEEAALNALLDAASRRDRAAASGGVSGAPPQSSEYYPAIGTPVAPGGGFGGFGGASTGGHPSSKPAAGAVPDRRQRPPPDLGPTIPQTLRLPPPRLTGRKRALLVGINYRGTSAELRGCHNDVRNVFELLTLKYGWDRSCVHALCDDGARGPSGEPTRANILNGMRWLTQDVEPGDVLFFAFSGHGAQQPDPHGYEEDGMNETILPSDFRVAGQITDDEIGRILVRTLPDGVRLTALMDSCHSGTGLDLPYTWTRDGYGRGFWREETNPYHSLGDVQMISGCEDGDVSCDARAYGRPGGAMTTAFCDVLRAHPAPTYDELLGEMGRVLRQRGMSQRPQLSSSQALETDRPFLLEDVCSNSNEIVGRVFRRRFPPRPRDLSGSPLGGMLGLGAAVVGGMMLGEMLGDGLVGDGLLGGGILGGLFG